MASNRELGYTPDPKSVQELTNYIEGALHEMQDKYQGVFTQITTRIDDMGHKMDDLEKDIAQLMTQAGVDDLRR